MSRRWPALTPTAVQCASPEEDAADRAKRGHTRQAAREKFAANGLCAALTQIAGVMKMATQAQHKVLQTTVEAVVRPPRAARAVRPIDLIQGPAACAPHPELDGGKGHVKAAGDLSQGHPPPCGRHHLPTSPFGTRFCCTADSSKRVSQHRSESSGDRELLTLR